MVGLSALAWSGWALAAAREYVIDAEASVLRVAVLRRGPLSVLAHDHILVAKGIVGRLTLNPEAPEQSSGQLGIPVALLVVDDPREREREGFSAELSESNRTSVRENMLAAGQLSGEDFPRITAVVERVEGRLPALRLRVRVRIRNRDQALTVPVTIAFTGDTLTVRGEAELPQTAFGIVPYETLFGAIAVQDAVRVKFEIIARPANP
jgi:polyisoprenoid-binding protein YceI